jgi:hypothetical protein
MLAALTTRAKQRRKAIQAIALEEANAVGINRRSDAGRRREKPQQWSPVKWRCTKSRKQGEGKQDGMPMEENVTERGAATSSERGNRPLWRRCTRVTMTSAKDQGQRRESSSGPVAALCALHLLLRQRGGLDRSSPHNRQHWIVRLPHRHRPSWVEIMATEKEQRK